MQTGKASWLRLRTPVLWLALLAAMGTLSLYASPYTVIMVTNILMYVILTVSWVLFSAPTGYISLATAAFFGVGIYTSATLGGQLPLPLIILTAGVASFVLAALVGALTLRLKGVYFAFFTFGLVELIKHLLLWYEVSVTGVRGRFVVSADNVTIYYIILGILVILLLTSYLIRRSRVGLALQAIGEGEDAAAHTGINVSAVKTFVFALSAVFAGAAGAAMATRWGYVDPYIAFDYLFSFTAVAMAVFGGLGRFEGPILGAVVFAFLRELLITRFPYVYMLVMGSVLVVTILYLPQGLVQLAQKSTWRRLRGHREPA
ncbi:MAG: branched-chain amino acid ABC transporter permease [Chloroflexi bacterium]|nr:branched-chain amino acid ABC transporter permease [Chloroflexota bacterium]